MLEVSIRAITTIEVDILSELYTCETLVSSVRPRVMVVVECHIRPAATLV